MDFKKLKEEAAKKSGNQAAVILDPNSISSKEETKKTEKPVREGHASDEEGPQYNAPAIKGKKDVAKKTVAQPTVAGSGWEDAAQPAIVAETKSTEPSKKTGRGVLEAAAGGRKGVKATGEHAAAAAHYFPALGESPPKKEHSRSPPKKESPKAAGEHSGEKPHFTNSIKRPKAHEAAAPVQETHEEPKKEIFTDAKPTFQNKKKVGGPKSEEVETASPPAHTEAKPTAEKEKISEFIDQPAKFTNSKGGKFKPIELSESEKKEQKMEQELEKKREEDRKAFEERKKAKEAKEAKAASSGQKEERTIGTEEKKEAPKAEAKPHAKVEHKETHPKVEHKAPAPPKEKPAPKAPAAVPKKEEKDEKKSDGKPSAGKFIPHTQQATGTVKGWDD